MEISEDKGVIDERLEEQTSFTEATQCSPGNAVNQGTMVDKNDQRKEFSISLSREEIEEDLYAITGTKPNPNPKKRPEAVQQKLDALFPGLLLKEVTKDKYKAAE